jgi:diguanylate cyclase (GGDEF)-like protein/PAS domain S-box-containing protein
MPDTNAEPRVKKDVTAPRSSSIAELEARLQFALDVADLGEWELDVNSGTLTCLLRNGPDFGTALQPDEWALEAFLERIHADDQGRVQRVIETALENTEHWQFDCRLLLSDGRTRWISVKGKVLGNADNNPRLRGIASDISELKRSEALAKGQQQALAQAVAGAPLKQILDTLTRSAEEQAGGNIWASVMLMDTDGQHLRFGSAPTLPESFNQTVERIPIGPLAGSCGTAAYTGSPVIVSDVESDPRWVEAKSAILTYGFRACWSRPILSSSGKVLGTLAYYCREARKPSAFELESMRLLVNTAALVIERDLETTERKAAEQALQASEQRFRSLVNATGAIVWTASPTLEIVSPQPDWSAFTGQTQEEMQGFGWMKAVHPDDQEPTAALGAKMLQDRQSVYAQYRLRRADGQYRHVSGYAVPILDTEGQLIEWAGSYTDVTEQKLAESRLHQLANHDMLTGLPNRAYLNEHLQALINFTPLNNLIAIMLIDLDRFKQVNDSMGHDAGDTMLREVAKRLRAAVPQGDLVARLGGDEFVVIAHAPEGKISAQTIADDIIRAVAAPIEINGSRVFSGASLGIGLYPEHGRTKEELVQHADIAMYRAKAAGGHCYRIFSDEMSIEAKSRMVLETALHQALEQNEFSLCYQPRMQLPEGKPKGVEVLIRWNHPEQGWISPVDFIPIAEEIGMIDELGLWVLHKACREIHDLSRRLGQVLELSVNLSPYQLKSPNLKDKIEAILEETELEPCHLELELTEGAFIEDMDASNQALRALKTLGIQLAVDDLGTRYSGISYLRRFPIDTVKLDRTLITHPAEGLDRYVFIKAITDMAHALNLVVVAEGVEDAETLELLKRAHCDEAQGYFLAEPLPLEDLFAFLSAPQRIT